MQSPSCPFGKTVDAFPSAERKLTKIRSPQPGKAQGLCYKELVTMSGMDGAWSDHILDPPKQEWGSV